MSAPGSTNVSQRPAASGRSLSHLRTRRVVRRGRVIGTLGLSIGLAMVALILFAVLR